MVELIWNIIVKGYMTISKRYFFKSIISYLVVSICLINLGCKKISDTELDIIKKTTPTQIEFDYTIETMGTRIYAKGNDGQIVHSSPDFNEVLNNVFLRLKAGGTLLIKGKYTGIDLITVPYNDIIIMGEGKDKTSLKLKDKADANFTNVDRLGMFDLNGVNDFQIHDLELDGNGENQLHINNGTLLNGPGYLSAFHIGAFGKTSKNTLIKNLYIHDFSMTGVYEEVDGIGTKVIDTEFARCYWNGITFNGTNSEASNCKISGSGDVGISLYGTNCVLIKCKINRMDGQHGSNNSRWGIAVEKEKKTSSGHRIIDCEVDGGILNSLNSGLAVVDGVNIYVENLEIKNASIFGVFLAGASNVIVINSEIQCAPTGFTQGFFIGTSILGVHSSGNILKSSIVKTNGFGVNIVDSQQSNNVVTHNVFTGGVQTAVVDKGTGTVVEANSVY